jgi:hypothetical protein
MTWRLSRFRVGDLVEVRGKEEILATLDEDGCVEGMPFMPEMLQFCGNRFRVGAVAHKTCDTARQTWRLRRLHATVHLAGLRCTGSAHGECQAACNLFWKDVWLQPVGDNGSGFAKSAPRTLIASSGKCTVKRLLSSTCLPSAGKESPCYTCQATKLYDATEPLAWWDVRQHVFDVVTRNRSLGRVLRVLWLESLRRSLRRVPYGYRVVKWFSEWMHRLLTGRPAPSLDGKVARGEPTPTGRLDLKPGEYVRIKTKEEIEQTLDEDGRNRGLTFDPEEMAPYCGRVFQVRSRVSQLIDEPTGKMIQMKQPCITLEGVVCNGEYASCRFNCPRAIFPYWRELWLERVDAPPAQVNTRDKASEVTILCARNPEVAE